MVSFFRDVGLAFVPLFVAIDAIGTIPVVISLTQDVTARQRARMVNIAILTAVSVGVGFLFLGKSVLRLLDISVAHFAIAGGLVLLILALRDLTGGKLLDTPVKEELIEVVPIGTPLTAGPATIATLLLLSDQYPVGAVLLSFALNLVVAWAMFHQAGAITGFLGQGGLKAVSKVASLLLAAIAVRMIFQGLRPVLGL
ncbi:MAG: MarC family protein [Chloroflexi bacterium]|nr:MarC family protein [Chloroflexota bacterium]